jgi:hypothetical protein
MATPRQGTTLFSALLILVGLAVIIQLWLVTAAMEALLAHQYKLLVPFAIGSALLFLVNVLLLRLVFNFDRNVR